MKYFTGCLALLCKGNKTELLQTGQQTLSITLRRLSLFTYDFPREKVIEEMFMEVSLSPEEILQPLHYKSFLYECQHPFVLFSLS